jgi:Tol biopolymer transport system component
LVQLTNNRAQDVNPAWSPDGSQLVFASDRDGNADIFVMNADGSNQRNLTRSRFPENYPAWSLNGNWLTFSRFTVNNEIFIMSVDGKCPAELPQSEIVETTQEGNCLVNLTKSSDADWSPIWLPRSIFSR